MHTRRVPTFSAAALLLVACAGAATAQAPPSPPDDQRSPEPLVTWGAEVDFSSRYIWHGLPFSDGMVVWPSAWVSARGFTAGISANVDRHYDPTLNEYDIYAGYEGAIGSATLTGTFSRYTYRELSGDPGSTSEVILRAAYAIGPGEVFTTHSFDVERYVGSHYADVGYAVERELTPRSVLQVEAAIAVWKKFAEKYAIPSDGPFGPAMVDVALVHKLTPTVGVRPHVTFTRLLDRTARAQLGTPGVSYGAAIVIGY